MPTRVPASTPTRTSWQRSIRSRSSIAGSPAIPCRAPSISKKPPALPAHFRKAAKHFDPPLQIVEIPFGGKKLIGYLQPTGDEAAVVMH
jgi:hypothetical protein